MISVIALIGAGWSLLKPFLNDREKKLLVVALPLQVLSNIAIIVTDEWAPGSISYNAWFNVLKVRVYTCVCVVHFVHCVILCAEGARVLYTCHLKEREGER